jgi:hypothetical protein
MPAAGRDGGEPAANPAMSAMLPKAGVNSEHQRLHGVPLRVDAMAVGVIQAPKLAAGGRVGQARECAGRIGAVDSIGGVDWDSGALPSPSRTATRSIR